MWTGKTPDGELAWAHDTPGSVIVQDLMRCNVCIYSMMCVPCREGDMYIAATGIRSPDVFGFDIDARIIICPELVGAAGFSYGEMSEWCSPLPQELLLSLRGHAPTLVVRLFSSRCLKR